MRTKAQIKASAKYNKENTVQFAFRLFIEKDAEVIKWLKEQPNKADYLRQLIAKDMEERK